MRHNSGGTSTRRVVAAASVAICFVAGCASRHAAPHAAAPATLAPVVTVALQDPVSGAASPTAPPPLFVASPTAPSSLAPSSTPAESSAPTSAPATAVTPSNGGIESVDFYNFTYDLGDGLGLGVVTVVNGNWEDGSTNPPVRHPSVDVMKVVKGDIDGDGRAEAAVALAWSGGGTGVFTDVLVYRWDGAGAVLAARDGVGDRAMGGVRSIAVMRGLLQIDRYDTDGGACCPARVVRRVLALRAGDQRLVDVGVPRTYVWLTLDTQDASVTPIHFLPGTDGAFIAATFAERSAAGEFEARSGQTLRLTVDGNGSLDVVQGGTVIGSATQETPLRLTLPATGTYEIRPVGAPADVAVRGFDAELTID